MPTQSARLTRMFKMPTLGLRSVLVGVVLRADADERPRAIARGQAAVSPLRLLVVTGGHDYPTSFYTLFEQPGLTWDHEATTEAAFRRDLRPRYDVLVLYDMPVTLSAPGRAHLRAFAESGKGIVVMHHALCSHNDWDWYRDLVGARYLMAPQDGRPASTYSHTRRFVAIARPHASPAPNVHGGRRRNLQGHVAVVRITPLLTTSHPKADPPLAG